MNKNFPLIVFFYFLSFIFIFSLENWFSLWLMLELNTLTFIPLMMTTMKSSTSENGISYFLIQTVSSLILVLSISPVFLFNYMFSPSLMFTAALVLKLAVAPLHSWVVPLSLSSPWTIFLLLLTIQKIMPLIFLEYSLMESSTMLVILCGLSLIFGSMSNLSANNMKFMALYSSISGMAWILIGINLSSSLWKMFIIIYFLSLFFILAQNTKKNKNSKNTLIFLNWMSIGGVPPLYGFLPKLGLMLLMSKMGWNSLMFGFLIFSLIDVYVYTRLNYMTFLFFSTSTSWQDQKLSYKMPLSWFTVNLLFFTLLI